MGSPPCAIFRYPDDLRNIVQQCAKGYLGPMVPQTLSPWPLSPDDVCNQKFWSDLSPGQDYDDCKNSKYCQAAVVVQGLQMVQLLLVGLVPAAIQHPSHHGVRERKPLLDFCSLAAADAGRRIRGICQREFTVVRPSSNLLSHLLHSTYSSHPQLRIWTLSMTIGLLEMVWVGIILIFIWKGRVPKEIP